MNDRLESYGIVRSVQPNQRRVKVVVSTSAVARDGMIIDQGGWDLREYQNNPVVLWAHNDRELPIAKAVETRIEGNTLVQEHQFFSHQRASEVFDLVANGGINATSVRWVPGETARRTVTVEGKSKDVLVFTRGHKLLEVSYVPIPSDPGALVVRADGSRVTAADFAVMSGPRRVDWGAVADALERAASEWQR